MLDHRRFDFIDVEILNDHCLLYNVKVEVDFCAKKKKKRKYTATPAERTTCSFCCQSNGVCFLSFFIILFVVTLLSAFLFYLIDRR